MATWRAENSMLTLRGVEILNKVKAGIGSITVTRIVAGSGRVPESQLYSQLTISGVNKLMVLSQSSSTDLGSELAIYITNEGYTEPFALQQIGIYVSHPDFEGEQLYHISQCDKDSFDTVPAFYETPVTYGYSLFLEHSNSDSFNITVDPVGMLPAIEFEKFKKNAVAGELLVLDENGNLKSTGKTLSQLYNKNLLHNWDFRKPVDLQMGYIVPQGTPYYSDTALTNQVGITIDVAKCIQVNSTCGIADVNAIAYYVPWSKAVRGYRNSIVSIDRWAILPGLTNHVGTVLIQDDGVQLSIGPNFGNFSQSVVYNYLPSSLFAGKTLTATVKVESLTRGVCQLYINDGVNQTGVEISSAGVFTVSRTIDNSPKNVAVIIQNNDTSEFCDLKISMAKLELGSISTLANEPPADYAEQVSICVQFDHNTGEYKGFTSLQDTANTLANASVIE